MKNLVFFIVEDDALYTQLLVDFLERLNSELEEYSITYHTFYSLKEAKYELSRMPDFVLLDYLVENDNAQPETALPLIDFIKEIHANIELIVVSGFADEQDKIMLETHGIKTFVEKDKNTFIKLREIILNKL
jgi:ActR/RegA family two-component response regulator